MNAYACQKCAKQFKQKKSLLNHLNVIHKMGENDKAKEIFDCPYCDRKFNGKSLLDKHMSYHGQNQINLRQYEIYY